MENSINNSRPKVDVIMPNYNKGNFVEESINSVIKQTYNNWHLYIIDDFSSDNSKQIINKFSNYKNIKIIKLKKNKGPSFCRNYAMRISVSKYIAFLDADDLWHEQKLEKQINFMEKNNLNFTYTNFTLIFQKGKKKKFFKKIVREFFDYKSFIKNSSINSTSMVIARSILGTIRFKKIKSEDYLFKCSLLKKNNIAKNLNENLMYYRILNKSRSRQNLKNMYWLWYINKHFNKLNFFENLVSIIFNVINYFRKYGVKRI